MDRGTLLSPCLNQFPDFVGNSLLYTLVKFYTTTFALASLSQHFTFWAVLTYISFFNTFVSKHLKGSILKCITFRLASECVRTLSGMWGHWWQRLRDWLIDQISILSMSISMIIEEARHDICQIFYTSNFSNI